MIPYLVAVREKVAVAVAANKLAKLPLRFHGGHPSITQPIVMPGPYEVLVGVGDSIRVVVHDDGLAAEGVGGTSRRVLLKAMLAAVVFGLSSR